MSRNIQIDFYPPGDMWDLRAENRRQRRSGGEQSPSLDYRIVPSPRENPRSRTAPLDDGRRDFPRYRQSEPPVIRQKFNDFGDLYPCTDEESEGSESPGFSSGSFRSQGRYRDERSRDKFPLPIVDEFEDSQYYSYDEDELPVHARHVTRLEQVIRIEPRDSFQRSYRDESKRGHQARRSYEEDAEVIVDSFQINRGEARGLFGEVSRDVSKRGHRERGFSDEEEVIMDSFRNIPSRPRRGEGVPRIKAVSNDGIEREWRRQEGHAEREEREQRDRLIRRLGGIIGQAEKNDFMRFRASSMEPMVREGRREQSRDFIGW